MRERSKAEETESACGEKPSGEDLGSTKWFSLGPD